MTARPAMIVLLSIAALLTLADIILVWGFRFLPLYDYPIWLYEVKALHAMGHGMAPYTQAFDVVKAPVPNLGFVGLVWTLAFFVTPEVAGKIALTICVVAFPWAWWWSTRRIAGQSSSWAFLGFPYALNLFFWGRTSYLLALIVFIIALGVFVPAHRGLRLRSVLGLSLVTLVIFLMHGVIFAVWALVLVCFLLRIDRGSRTKVLDVCIVLLPAAICAVWFVRAYLPATLSGEMSFGVGTVGRAVLKPLMPFIKTYGIPALGPISAYNLIWLGMLSACIVFYVKKITLRNVLGKTWLAGVGLVLCAGVLLPDPFLAVVQPGGYFVFPAMFLLSVSVKQDCPIWPIPVLLVGAALCVTGYSMMHVARVDRQMSGFFEGLQSKFEPSLPFATICFDWPAGSGACDEVSPSVNPLFGGPYYALLEDDGVATIHETSLLHLHSSYAWLRQTTVGATRPAFQESVQQQLPSLERFPQLVVTGENESSRAIASSLVTAGYRVTGRGDYWTIFRRDLREP